MSKGPFLQKRPKTFKWASVLNTDFRRTKRFVKRSLEEMVLFHCLKNVQPADEIKMQSLLYSKKLITSDPRF